MAQAPDPSHDREEATAYIYDVCLGLARVARQQRLPFLVYLLEIVAMAAQEHRGAEGGKKSGGG